ncbi:Copine I [Spironucleus salmonicida]|uniref:Copine I n=1 Tax=Spironucleus salmonicida TaxID=348837 RepID=V6LD03_9EUKA|nr:Copine I [Spironucleus salmonicida]|eukprot:EST42133.1 Copine I [Spironucleus salmonicida]
MTDPFSLDFLRQNLESIKVMVAIDFSSSNNILHFQSTINNQITESPYRRILFYILSNLSRLDAGLEIELLTFDSQVRECKLMKGKNVVADCLQLYDLWAKNFQKQLQDRTFDMSGTSISDSILYAIKKVNADEEMTILLILTDGKLANPVKESHAVCEAALHPLVISAIGVTLDDEDPRFQSQFDTFYLLDDNIYDRVFDNFNFTPFIFNQSNSKWWYSGISDPNADNRLNHYQQKIDQFFDDIFLELPEQALILSQLKYFERDFEQFKQIYEKKIEGAIQDKIPSFSKLQDYQDQQDKEVQQNEKPHKIQIAFDQIINE